MLGLAALASVGALIFLRSPGAEPATAQSVRPVHAQPATPSELSVKAEAQQQFTPTQPRSNPPPTAVPAAPVPPLPAAPSAQAPAPDTNAASAAAAQARAEEEARSHAAVMAAIAARERERAGAALTITMYSTSWCKACIAARAHMQANAIAFTDHDVEADPAAKARQLQLNPRGSVPTIDVDGREVLVGFSARNLQNAMTRAVAARTGS